MWLSMVCAMALLGEVPAEPIQVYDLTYTLKFDASKPTEVADAWDHCHAVATLQGIVNREGPSLYVRLVESRGLNIDDYWLKRMSEPGQWLHGRPVHEIRDITALVQHYRGRINGAVVYDPRVPATSNLASTIAGVENLIAIRYDPRPDSLYTMLVTIGPRLPVVRRLMNEDGGPMFTGRGTIPDTDIPSTGSAKCDAHLWLKHLYLDTGKVDATYAGYYIDPWWMRYPRASHPNHHTLSNHDFFVARKGWFFDLHVWPDEAPNDDPGQRPGTDLETLKAMLLSAYRQGGKERMIHVGGFTPWAFKYTDHGNAGGKHGGVATEWEMVRICSAYNAYVDADAIEYGAMANASFFMHFPLRESYAQRWVTHEELRARGYLTAEGQVNFDGREFMIFYVGDFDSAAWIYQTLPRLWDHPARGGIPLMWCVTPLAERRAPMVLDYLRRTATPNDYFAVADNGAGYLNPGMLHEPRDISGLPCGLAAWAKHCQPMYRRWDLTITGFIIDGFAPGLSAAGLDCYASFSPNGIVPQKTPASLLHGKMPVLQFDYDLGGSPEQAAQVVMARVGVRKLPFHWFRAILCSPDWYASVYEKVREANPRMELLDAPTFFELYRVYLKSNPQAATGQIESAL